MKQHLDNATTILKNVTRKMAQNDSLKNIRQECMMFNSMMKAINQENYEHIRMLLGERIMFPLEAAVGMDPPEQAPEPPVKPFLPPIDPNYTYTLVLDLDETLIHYIEQGEMSNYLIRPGCVDFLLKVS